MRIVAPNRFVHAGELSAQYDTFDPRSPRFVESEVEIDLRDCAFVRPAAVLWCVVYPLLAKYRGSACSLLVPMNMGVSVYLKTLGLFKILQDNSVDVDDRDVFETRDPQVVLPLSGFIKEVQVEQLANDALESLHRLGLGVANIRPVVSEVFAELAMNAVQHAESPIGAYGFIQFYEFDYGRRFVCGVCDGGVGIRSSLERNPQLRSKIRYDWDALELAVQERVSGTGDPRRGIGLYGIAEDMRSPDRQLIMHSGLGALELGGRSTNRGRRTRLFPGTLAYVSIPT